MNRDSGASTWCRRCQAFYPCEVIVSADNGIYKSYDEGYRVRHRLCKNCNSHFATYEVDAEYLRNLKWDYRMAKQELEYAKLSREKIQELVENLLDYYKEDNEFWKEREALFSEDVKPAGKDSMNSFKRLFPTKSELEAMKAAIKSLHETGKRDSEPHLRIVEDIQIDQQDD